jgi:hypothetical protein
MRSTDANGKASVPGWVTALGAAADAGPGRPRSESPNRLTRSKVIIPFILGTVSRDEGAPFP